MAKVIKGIQYPDCRLTHLTQTPLLTKTLILTVEEIYFVIRHKSTKFLCVISALVPFKRSNTLRLPAPLEMTQIGVFTQTLFRLFTRSSEEIILRKKTGHEHCKDNFEDMNGTDFFSFFIRTPTVGDRNLIKNCTIFNGKGEDFSMLFPASSSNFFQWHQILFVH